MTRSLDTDWYAASRDTLDPGREDDQQAISFPEMFEIYVEVLALDVHVH